MSVHPTVLILDCGEIAGVLGLAERDVTCLVAEFEQRPDTELVTNIRAYLRTLSGNIVAARSVMPDLIKAIAALPSTVVDGPVENGD